MGEASRRAQPLSDDQQLRDEMGRLLFPLEERNLSSGRRSPEPDAEAGSTAHHALEMCTTVAGGKSWDTRAGRQPAFRIFRGPLAHPSGQGSALDGVVWSK
jgi:hypothetical protein